MDLCEFGNLVFNICEKQDCIHQIEFAPKELIIRAFAKDGRYEGGCAFSILELEQTVAPLELIRIRLDSILQRIRERANG